jgi:tetratricopeptide (TPR) repeat protein
LRIIVAYNCRLKAREPQAQNPAVSRRVKIASLILALGLVTIYASHFNSEFHLDDIHTTVQNPWIRDLHNLPRFFTDTDTSGVLAANRVFRPLLTTSLAVDYWLGGGLKPVFFHASNLFWFLVLLTLFFLLCRKIFQKIWPGEAGDWIALFVVALYGLHPAIADTVSYVIQRSEIYSTAGVVAGLVMYIYLPRQRRYCLYLIPVILGILTKPPALVFPILLFLYLWLLEEETRKTALVRSVPAIVTTVAFGILTSLMTPRGFSPGASSGYGYRITQPAVTLGYFRTFFIPTGLTADTDRAAYSSLLQDDAIAGFVFLLALLYVALYTSRRRETRPIAFGVLWFLVALLPTAIFPLAEVENDHRMFFPFVGLTVAVCSAGALWLARKPVWKTIVIPVCGLALAGFAYGSWQRADVWQTEESLWRDVTIKSPRNGRGLMNYGLTLMARGDYHGALYYFQRALTFTPNYSYLEINLGIAYAGLNNKVEAERHFLRGIQLAPGDASAQYFYARWLKDSARFAEAATALRAAIGWNPSYADAYYLLMQLYANQFDATNLHETASQMLALFPSDQTAADWLARSSNLKPTPEAYLENSLAYYRAGDYANCIEVARKALELRPTYAAAWNNIGAAYNAMQQWAEGVHAEQEAVRLDPNFQLAKNNLAWAQQQLAAQHK